jgi:hypothetical protein
MLLFIVTSSSKIIASEHIHLFSLGSIFASKTQFGQIIAFIKYCQINCINDKAATTAGTKGKYSSPHIQEYSQQYLLMCYDNLPILLTFLFLWIVHLESDMLHLDYASTHSWLPQLLVSIDCNDLFFWWCSYIRLNVSCPLM